MDRAQGFIRATRVDRLSEPTITAVITWVVIVTVISGILLPFAVNTPALPFYLYSLVMRDGGAQSPARCVLPNQTGNPEGLLVWYDFEGDFSRFHRVLDRSGNNNHAVVQGLFMDPARGIVGNQSLSFSGAGRLLAACNPAAGIHNVSFSLWYKTGDMIHDSLMAGTIPADNPRTGWAISTLSFELLDNGGVPLLLSGSEGHPVSLSPNTWTHRVIVLNGSRITEYLNGQPAGEWRSTGSPLGTGRAMNLGTWQPFGFNFAGQIDDFRIYNRALGPSEVAGLYRQGFPVTVPG